MPFSLRSRRSQYLVASTLWLAGFLLRLVLLPLDAKHPFITFYPASILAFLWCGPLAGAGVVVLSALAGYFVFTPPPFTFAPTFDGAVAVLFFALSTSLIGWIVHRLSVTSRINEQQRDLLRIDEERYRTVVQDQTEVICRYKADGTFTFVNNAFCRLFGGTTEKYLGHAWQPVAFSDDVPAIRASLATLSPGNPVVTIENRVYAADGSLRWGQFINRAYFDQHGELVEVQAVGRDVTERKRLEEALADNVAALEDLYHHAPCGYHSLDASGTYVKINATELTWLGVTRDEVIGKCTPLDFFTEEGREQFRRTFPALKAAGRIEGLEFDLVSRQGVQRRVSLSATVLRGPNGEITTRSVFFDISESHRLKQQLAALIAEQHAMLDNELIGIVKLIDRQTVWTNRALERMLGYGAGELLGKPSRMIYPDDASFEKLGREAYPVLKAGGTFRTEIQLIRKDGSLFWAHMHGTLVSPDSNESLWLFADVTGLKEQQERAHHLATHDALTGLPNRRLLVDSLSQATLRASRSGTFVAAVYIDLDGFKPINDTHGHAAGDQVLVEIAQRMRLLIRNVDLVVRLGGDEFVMILPDLPRPDDAMLAVERLAASIAEPVVLAGSRTARVTGSIGVAIYPLHSETPDELLRVADEAMFVAKERGGSQIFRFPLDQEHAPGRDG